jgi:hypothetical protein
MAVNQYFNMLPTLLGMKEQSQKIRQELMMETTEFEARWAAD